MTTNKILTGFAMIILAMSLVLSSCDRDTDVSGVELNRTSPATLAIGETDTLVATIIPSNATNQNVFWSTDNAEVVTVTEGIVTAVGLGTARVTVTTDDRGLTASVDYTVVPKRVPPTGVVINNVTGTTQGEPMEIVDGTITIIDRELFTLQAKVSPEDTEEAVVNRDVTWVSRNPAVVLFGETGATTIQTRPGETYVVVTTVAGGFQDSVKVIVKPIRVENIELNVTELKMRIGNIHVLTPTIEPENASFQEIEWDIEVLEGPSGEEDTIVTVVNGVVTGFNEGRVRVIARATEGGLDGAIHYAEVEVTVSGLAVSGITLDTNAVEFTVNSVYTFTRTILPAGATDLNVTWTSSNPNVVRITPAGPTTAATATATAIGIGTSTITATTVDGEFRATATVTVVEGPPVQCVMDFLQDGLGEVYFRTNTTWTVGNQVWSDVVIASVCGKEAHYATVDFGNYGLTTNTFASDCRRGTLTGEDLSFFTWCAVMMHQDVLCPEGWRVPTAEDFVTLVAYINDGEFSGLEPGGNGQLVGDTEVNFNFVQRFFGQEWGADRVGRIGQTGARSFAHTFNPTTSVTPTHYWGNDALTATGASGLMLGITSEGTEPRGGNVRINVASMMNKHGGALLRCVKDN